ncbi:MAG: hypothetical protein WBX26_02640 [Candidatus Cybelea sp.]
MNAAELYDRLEQQVRALLDGESDFVANAGNFAALIYGELPDVNWAGFYLATPSGELVLGPFSGRPACTPIPQGRRSYRLRRRVAQRNRGSDLARRPRL